MFHKNTAFFGLHGTTPPKVVDGFCCLMSHFEDKGKDHHLL